MRASRESRDYSQVVEDVLVISVVGHLDLLGAREVRKR
jgi:hypothetical protein